MIRLNKESKRAKSLENPLKQGKFENGKPKRGKGKDPLKRVKFMREDKRNTKRDSYNQENLREHKRKKTGFLEAGKGTGKVRKKIL